MFLLYICISIPGLQTGSSVSFLKKLIILVIYSWGVFWGRFRSSQGCGFELLKTMSVFFQFFIDQGWRLYGRWLRGAWLELGQWEIHSHDTVLSHSRCPAAVSQTCQVHQFSSVTQSCPTLCDPMNCSTPGLPVHHQLPEFTQTHVHWVGDAIQPSHPRSSPSPPAPNPSQHQSLFQWVNSSHEVAKVLEFQL